MAMSVSPDPHIEFSLDQAVLVLAIKRPEKKNALTPGMYRALGQGLLEAEASDRVNVILIRGMDDCFTSGNDVNSFVAGNEEPGERPSKVFMTALSQARKPVVAAVGGLAIGIGTTMLLHCDLVYASEESFLQLPFARLGLCPEFASSQLLPLFVGHQRAAELLLLGDRFGALQAKDMGLINEVLPRDKYLAHAMSKARELAALPSEALQTTKRLMKRAYGNSLDETMRLELEDFGRLLKTEEAQSIFQAFLNRKRA